ncbi:DNA polymerase III subunit delta' [Roseibium sediminis]|uniref:DNA polymerase III subunit delta' n=1 Tax=Roseibium sediminis TaxID=1775174 RepID=UPI00123D74B9|nr:DNA polymerase III subunit delta' [Roseibium sediminis]
MAPRNEIVETPEVDALPGVPLPREQSDLIGHAEIERALLDAYRSDRFHHAWILGGPKGIGKATLAFRFARFALAHPDRFGDVVGSASSLSVSSDSTVYHQIAAGAHPNVLHLRRPWDERGKRFKSDLPVDEVRKTVSFFGTTASANAWRVCIVDAADDMNQSSANALLKILEEPPARSVFLVLSHTPGRLLPTIRSRCRRLDLAPLSEGELATGLSKFAPDLAASERDIRDVTSYADGSLRSAFVLLAGDGLAIARGFMKLVQEGGSPSIGALHGLGDLVSARGQSDNWESFQHVAEHYLHGLLAQSARSGPSGLSIAHEISGLWEQFNQAVRDADALNLDRKQVVLDLVLKLARLRVKSA